MRVRMLSLSLALLFAAVALSGCTEPASSGDPTTSGNGEPELPPQNVTVTWGTVESATLRPGAALGDEDGPFCTLNFLFTDANGSAYIGTAGHCTDKVGERTMFPRGDEFGTVVFDSDVSPGADPAVDFSLIRLDPDQVASAHPRMLGFDGPKDVIAAGEAAPGDEIALYGYGLVLGQDERTRPRSGVLVEEDGRLYKADMPAVNGDSGSPIIHVATGKAFGVISHYGVTAVPPSTDEGPIMPFILDELDKGGFAVTVATG